MVHRSGPGNDLVNSCSARRVWHAFVLRLLRESIHTTRYMEEVFVQSAVWGTEYDRLLYDDLPLWLYLQLCLFI